MNNSICALNLLLMWLACCDKTVCLLLMEPRQPQNPRPNATTVLFWRLAFPKIAQQFSQSLEAGLRHVVIVDELWRLFVLRIRTTGEFVGLRKWLWEQECKDHNRAGSEDDKQWRRQGCSTQRSGCLFVVLQVLLEAVVTYFYSYCCCCFSRSSKVEVERLQLRSVRTLSANLFVQASQKPGCMGIEGHGHRGWDRVVQNYDRS